MTVTVEIPFDPVPWSAPRLGRNGHVFDIRERDKRAIRCCIKNQYEGPLHSGICALSFDFVFPVPKSYNKKNRQLALELELVPTKCDCTNLQKLYEDCLKGIVIKDDRNVFMILSKKRFGQKGSVTIRIYPYPPSDQ